VHGDAFHSIVRAARCGYLDVNVFMVNMGSTLSKSPLPVSRTVVIYPCH
jgi:hypothetical protein